LLNLGVIEANLDPNAKLVLISHDCDIVHHSYALEPYVEFFIARPAVKQDGSKTKGKNPRHLQFHLSIDGKSELYEISIHEKYRDARNVLERGEPALSSSISQTDIRMISRWAAKRYSRPAFPSSFNDRISAAAKKKIKRTLEQYGGKVSGIFIFLETDHELQADQTYRVVVRVVAPKSALDNDEEERVLIKLIAELQTAFAICPGIEVMELKLDSEADFSLEDFNMCRLWDYEFLSVSEEGEEGDHTYLLGSGS